MLRALIVRLHGLVSRSTHHSVAFMSTTMLRRNGYHCFHQTFWLEVLHWTSERVLALRAGVSTFYTCGHGSAFLHGTRNVSLWMVSPTLLVERWAHGGTLVDDPLVTAADSHSSTAHPSHDKSNAARGSLPAYCSELYGRHSFMSLPSAQWLQTRLA